MQFHCVPSSHSLDRLQTTYLENWHELSNILWEGVHHVRNTEVFVNEIHNLSINQDEIMASLDVVSLFTKIPVDLALDVFLHRLESWTDISSLTEWSINDICQGLKICLNATHLHFRGNNYQQIFGTAMGSPVSAVIANMVMEDVETRSLNTFISGPKLWQRYIDDTFVLL